MEDNKIYYREIMQYKYELTKMYAQHTVIYPSSDIITKYVALLRTGTLVIREHYAWDGASKPAINTKSNRRASLVHDALYQLMRLGLLDYTKWRAVADKYYYDICVEDKMFKWRANLEYWAVANFAEFAARPSQEPEIVVNTAP